MTDDGTNFSKNTSSTSISTTTYVSKQSGDSSLTFSSNSKRSNQSSLCSVIDDPTIKNAESVLTMKNIFDLSKEKTKSQPGFVMPEENKRSLNRNGEIELELEEIENYLNISTLKIAKFLNSFMVEEAKDLTNNYESSEIVLEVKPIDQNMDDLKTPHKSSKNANVTTSELSKKDYKITKKQSYVSQENANRNSALKIGSKASTLIDVGRQNLVMQTYFVLLFYLLRKSNS